MSTFRGFLKEVPGIAVDRFEEECLKSQFLFLSHCHTDHMVGLSDKLQLTVPLFTSEVSAVFLRKEFPNLSNVIEPLNVGTPLHLKYTFDGEEFSLEVTALPAKHCPGSVMFLFETKDHTVLYTGDFRVSKADLNKYDILRTKQIECVYLDSTFLMEKYNEFPTRVESLMQICSLIKEWLDKHPNNSVIIEMPANYGVEFLYLGIERKLKEKIHVKSSQWEKYIHLPALDKCIEPDETKCRIFARLKEARNKSKQILPANIRVIKPSAMYWENWNRCLPFVEKVEGRNEYRVAYSSHCSCSELKDFLDFVKPKNVRLNVIPKNYEQCLMKTLSKIYNTAKKDEEDLNDFTTISFDNIFFIPQPNKVEEDVPVLKLPPKRLKMSFT